MHWFLVGAQAFIALRDLLAGDSLLPAAQCAVHAITAVILAKWPHAYWRHRRWALPLSAVPNSALPSLRQAGIGAARALNRGAQPGALGAAHDVLRIAAGEEGLAPAPQPMGQRSPAAASAATSAAGLLCKASINAPPPLHAGTRCFACFFFSLFAPQAPAGTLATHLVHLLATNNSPAYCASPLLSDPLSAQRQAAAAQMLDMASLPLMAMMPELHTTFKPGGRLGAAAGHGGTGPQPACGMHASATERHALPACLPAVPPGMPTCRGTLVFYRTLLDLLLPVLHSVYTWRPELGARGGAPLESCPAGLRGWVVRAAAAADEGVYRLLGGGCSLPVRCLVVYYLMANLWLLCRA